MALTYTPDAELNSPCPEFSLKSVDGKIFSKSDLQSKDASIFMFICNHCPYVKAIEKRLIQLGNEMIEHNVQILAICSNDSTDFPEDSPENLLKRWKEMEYPFPYLIDESQSVAKEFQAVCTPDFFVYDGSLRLVYRGRLDDSWKDDSKVTSRELILAVRNILSGESINEIQIPSMGCSIKWK